jgi:hypothetical protein
VRALVDFGAAQLFAEATTYSSVVFLSRRPAATVPVARFQGGRWHTAQARADSLAGGPWRLAVGAAREFLARLGERGPRLGACARICKGAGTNADPVYVFEQVGAARGELVPVRSRALGGREVPIERGLLRACLRGRDVRSWASASPAVCCLVPYDRAGRFIEPELLARRFPAAHDYFVQCRALLEAREAGRFRGPAFYQFGRPQNLAFLGSRAAKVVVPDVARRGRALVDTAGAMVLDSAYALRPLPGAAGDYPVEILCALLNSSLVIHWLRAAGVPLRGGYTRLKTAFLQHMPLPPRSPGLAALGARLRQGVAADDAAEIDELVRRACGVARPAWQLDDAP